MGGYGSSRWRWHSKKDTVEDSKCIEISWLKQHGYFCGWKSGGIEWRNFFGQVYSSIGISVSTDEENPNENFIRLFYSKGPNGEIELDYKVQLITTPCNLGGVRYWFKCPLIKNGEPCERKVSKIYLPPGSRYFGCRHCHDLTYTSSQEHDGRMDALFKNPEMLLSKMKAKDPKVNGLALKAYVRSLGRS